MPTPITDFEITQAQFETRVDNFFPPGRIRTSTKTFFLPIEIMTEVLTQFRDGRLTFMPAAYLGDSDEDIDRYMKKPWANNNITQRSILANRITVLLKVEGTLKSTAQMATQIRYYDLPAICPPPNNCG